MHLRQEWSENLETDEGLSAVAFSGVPFSRQAESLNTKEPSFEVSRTLTVVVDKAGIEPATCGLGHHCSDLLSYLSVRGFWDAPLTSFVCSEESHQT